jgi:hypothetical protein
MAIHEVRKRPSLEDVLSYENGDVIKSFLKSFDVPKEEAEELFEQLKCMLWLMNELNFDKDQLKGNAFSIDQSLLVLDEMWHCFILFTEEYMQFCISHFGHFIHHEPIVEIGEERQAAFHGLGYHETIDKVMDEKRWQYIYVYKKLGRQCFVKWYTEYHQTYTEQRLLELRVRNIHGHRPDRAAV